jgi:hypothetical protein
MSGVLDPYPRVTSDTCNAYGGRINRYLPLPFVSATNRYPIRRLRCAAHEQQRQHYCFRHSLASLATVSHAALGHHNSVRCRAARQAYATVDFVKGHPEGGRPVLANCLSAAIQVDPLAEARVVQRSAAWIPANCAL